MKFHWNFKISTILNAPFFSCLVISTEDVLGRCVPEASSIFSILPTYPSAHLFTALQRSAKNEATKSLAFVSIAARWSRSRSRSVLRLDQRCVNAWNSQQFPRDARTVTITTLYRETLFSFSYLTAVKSVHITFLKAYLRWCCSLD